MPPDADTHRPDIVVVTHFYPSRGGGVERVAGRLVAGYLSAGLEVEWFASAPGASPGDDARLRISPVRAFDPLERIAQIAFPLWTPAALPRLWRAIRSARAVHVHEHFYPSSIAAVAIGRMLGRRVVLTQHAGEMRLRRRWLARCHAACARLLALPVMGLANRVAFVSANVMEFFGRWAGTADHRSLVFNGLDTSLFRLPTRDQRRDARARLGLDMHDRVVAFVGRHVRKKGIGLVGELARSAPEIVWLCAGDGPEDPAGWGLGNARALGRLEQPRLAEIYAAADLLVLPSSGEGFPLVVQEALACGAAVLSTPEVARACPEAEHMIRSETLALDGSDAARWLAGVRAVLAAETSDPHRQARARAAAALWSWERCSTDYMELLGVATLSRDRVDG